MCNFVYKTQVPWENPDYEMVKQFFSMDIKKETYKQKSFFQTGLPFFGAALFFLIPALCFCLGRNTLLLAIILLAIGLLLLMLGVGRTKGETKHILQFVRDESIFYHKCDSPLIISDLLANLEKEGFDVAEYPFGNYYGHRYIDRKYHFHFFVANHDTPDCPEAESYSKLFIQIVCGAGMAADSQYLWILKYGAGLEQKSPEYIQAVREGLMHDKNGCFFGFRLAYDTGQDILYCAEAFNRILWHKSETTAIYASELMKTLFLNKAGTEASLVCPIVH